MAMRGRGQEAAGALGGGVTVVGDGCYGAVQHEGGGRWQLRLGGPVERRQAAGKEKPRRCRRGCFGVVAGRA